MSRFIIDWNQVYVESTNGNLLQYMRKHIPQDQWNQVDEFEDAETLLHNACFGNNIDAILFLVNEFKMDMNIRDIDEDAPIDYAFLRKNYRSIEVLLALGAKMPRSKYYLPEKALIIFIANGLRVKDKPDKNFDKNERMIQFEQGVVQCRDVIVTLLGLKKRRQHDGRSLVLPNLDRFLVKEVLAVEIWATRSCENEKWQQ